MKVILTTDVPKVGNRYDIKDFKEGYAQNVLISKGLAILATPGALANLASKKAQMEKKRDDEIKVFESLISSINNIKINIKVKANEKGHLFKAISHRDVATAIKEITGIEIEESAIVIDNIKELGTHSVIIKKGNKSGKCEIVVEKD